MHWSYIFFSVDVFPENIGPRISSKYPLFLDLFDNACVRALDGMATPVVSVSDIGKDEDEEGEREIELMVLVVVAKVALLIISALVILIIIYIYISLFNYIYSKKTY